MDAAHQERAIQRLFAALEALERRVKALEQGAPRPSTKAASSKTE